MRSSGIVAAGLLFVIALAACGEDKPFADAAVGSDADEIDAAELIPDALPAGQVTVTTHSRCCVTLPGPLAGVDVFVVGPDGTIGDTAVTGADGTAVVDVVTGDSVTAAYPRSNGADLATVVGVEPGDSLTFGDKFRLPDGLAVTTTFSWPAAGSTYRLFAPCGSTLTAATSVVDSNNFACGKLVTDYLVIAEDSKGIATNWGMFEDVMLVDSGDETLAAWSPAGTLDVTVSGLPSEVTFAAITSTLVVDGRNTFEHAQSGVVTSGATLLASVWPTGAGDRIASVVRLDRSGFGSQEVHDTAGPSTTARPLTPTLLPWVTEAIGNATLGTATWLQTAMTGYDGAVLQISWRRAPVAGLFGGSNDDTFSWTIVLPPGISEVEFPPVPAALASSAPGAADSIVVEVSLLDLSGVDGYAAFRARPEWVLDCPQCAHASGELTAPTVQARSIDAN